MLPPKKYNSKKIAKHANPIDETIQPVFISAVVVGPK